MPRRPMTEEQKRNKRERDWPQSSIPVIAQTWWKKLLHKFFSWTLNRLLFQLFLRMRYISSGCLFL